MPKWEFASTGGGYEEGINNTLTEHFEGNYNYYLAREIIQNSLDARDSEDEPVKVIFSLEHQKTEYFPGKDRFLEILKLCRSSHPENSKNKEFFTSSIKMFQNEFIPVMKISDHNTIGLHGGDSERHSPWFALVKSRGVSPKEEGSGGSFGLGKGAVFAASHLRTALYSSTSKEDSKSRFLGVSMLVNFDEGSDTKQSIGSFGSDHQGTIYDPKNMEEYWRKEKGLDIYIMGYKVEEDWEDELLKSVLRNFWYAILNEDLIVEVGSKIVNFDNLETLLTGYFSGEPLRDYDEPKGNPLSYYQAVINGKTFKEQLPQLGKVSFHFAKLDEQLNYVAMLRKSHMVIYSRIFHFPSPYAGVFICDDNEGNEKLRKMEPPAHDKWDPDRKKEDGRQIMDEVTEWVRSCLRKMKQQRSEEISDIPGLAKYLPLDEEEADDPRSKGESDNEGDSESTETQKKEPVPEVFDVNAHIEPYSVSILNQDKTGMGGTGKVRRGGKRRLKSRVPAPGGGEGKAKALSDNEISIKMFSNSAAFTDQEYTIVIKGDFNGRCNLKIRAIGDEGSEKVKIKEVLDPRGHKYHIHNNCIHGFYMDNGDSIEVKIKLEDKMKLSLKAEAYEI